MDRAVAVGLVRVVGAGKLGHPLPELGAAADAVDQPGAKRRLGHVAARGGDRGRRVGDILGDLRARPRLSHVLLPGAPESVGEGLGGAAGLGRHVASRIGLDRRLERADPVDVGGHPEPLEQAGIIEVASARAGDEHRAQRIEPDLVGMGGELVGVVAIARGVGDDALVGAPNAVERLPDIGDRRLAAAGEQVEVEGDGLDVVVGRGGVERVDQLAHPILAGHGRSADQVEGVPLRGLLDDRSGKLEAQGAALGAVLVRAGGKRRVEAAEEDQHEDQDERVLDPDQHLPRLAQKPHRSAAPLPFRG